MTDRSDLGDRIKSYEDVPRINLTPRMPVIIRLDGKSFHSYTKGFDRPWDPKIYNAMMETSKFLLKNISGAELAYTQSDEISILINTFKKFNTKPWFDNSVQKIVSVAASLATGAFNKEMSELTAKIASFDARCFVVPREDVVNAFLWRQQDAIRNSISGLAQKHFSHKQLFKKSCADMKEMLKSIGNDWDNCPSWQKYGVCISRGTKEISPGVFRSAFIAHEETPLFNTDTSLITNALVQEEN